VAAVIRPPRPRAALAALAACALAACGGGGGDTAGPPPPDETAPAAPALGSIVPPSPANENAPVLSGSAEPGARVEVYASACVGEPLASVIAGEEGAFSVAVPVADDTAVALHLRAVDAAGNPSGCAAGSMYVEDSTAPAVPAIGSVTPSGPANENIPVLLGTSEPGAVVTIHTAPGCGDDPAAVTVAAEDGTFVVAVDVADDSVTTFRIVARDAVGNASSCADGPTYVEDSTGPAAPSLVETVPPSPASAATVLVRGAAEPGARVTLHRDPWCGGASVGDATAGPDGAFEIAVVVERNATTTFHARAADAGGISSACSGPLAYVEDSLAPTAPAFAGTIPASPANANAPVLAGAAEPGATLRVYGDAGCGGPPLATLAVPAGGTFEAPLAVGDDTTTAVSARATDAAGNASACASGPTYVEDSTAPAAPAIASVSPPGPANENTPVLSGAAEAGASVTIHAGTSCGGAPLATATAAEDGSFTVAVSVPDDAVTAFSAVARDRAGNPSPCAEGPSYIEDSTGPATPGLVDTVPPSPANAAVVLVRGVAEPGVGVTLHLDAWCAGAPASEGTAGPDGAFEIAVLVDEDAVTTLHARASDAVGNASACSGPLLYVEDSIAPPAPALAATAPVSPANENAPVLSGTAEAGATLRVYGDLGCGEPLLATLAVPQGGSFEVALAVEDDSETIVSARATDAAGNSSPCTPGPTYVEDSTAPAAPVFASGPASPSSDPVAIVAGQGDAGEAIEVFADGACAGAPLEVAMAAPDGAWSVDAAVAPNAPTTFGARAVDAAGNASECVAGPTYVHDDLPPVFDGLVSATGVDDAQNRVRLTWDAAADASTPASAIVYEICRATSWGGCGAFEPTYTVTGATSYDDRDVQGWGRYWYVVRARDALGHRDANAVQRMAKPFADYAVLSVAGGGAFTCVLDRGGRTSCFGGPAGHSAGFVTGLPRARAIAAGLAHACALADDGGVWCWGDNASLQLGTATSAAGPVRVAGLPPAVAIDAGDRHGCALLADGTVRCWGANDAGQLGRGATGSPSPDPVSVTGLSGVLAIACGANHACGLRADGTVRCWGAAGPGALGNGSTADAPAPVTFAGGGYVALAAGGAHTCALTASREVWCAGSNADGELGNDRTSPSATPVQVTSVRPTPTTTAAVPPMRKIALGSRHSCAADGTGAVWCWGDTSRGQVGQGGLDQLLPVPVKSGIAALKAEPGLWAGRDQACVSLAASPHLACWGYGGLGSSMTPFKPTGHALSDGAALLVAGRAHVCAVAGQLPRCFGAGAEGQLGTGGAADASRPADVSWATESRFFDLAAGGASTLAADSLSTAYAWGANGSGQLGDGGTAARLAPSPGALLWPVAVSDHGCGVAGASGFVQCWGRNDRGQVGNGAVSDAPVLSATSVRPYPYAPARGVTVGALHACALLADGTVACWGDGSVGQLGDGTATFRASRGIVAELTDVVEIDAGGGFTTCARRADGRLRCWGENALGQIGDGTTVRRDATETVSAIASAFDVAVGLNHACAVLADGSVQCWGSNASGALGDGTLLDSPEPIEVPGLPPAKAVVVGDAHTCALLADGTARCWGENGSGQLGDGTFVDRATPAPVEALP
jgi:alpha-tubulin suppressor-like RCC1 family protein